MERTEHYNRTTEYKIAERVATAIATRRGINPDAYGYVPNRTSRSAPLNATQESVRDALFIINSFDIRTRVSRLAELNDKQFLSDVNQCLQNFR